MSKHSQEEDQAIAYYDEFQKLDHMDYDEMMDFFSMVREKGYDGEANIMEDEWRAANKKRIERIESDEQTYRSMQTT